MKQNPITFNGVLVACNHASLVVEGWHNFDFMRDHYYSTSHDERYACMMYLLGHVGHLDKALNVIRNMPF